MSKSIGTEAFFDGAFIARPAAANADRAIDPMAGVRMDQAISEALASIANEHIAAGAPFALGCYEIPGDRPTRMTTTFAVSKPFLRTET